MNRSETRNMAYKLLYSLEIQKPEKNEIQEQIEIFIANNDITENNVKDYIYDVINGIYENEDKIIPIIEKNLKDEWTIDRVSKTNLSILKLATFEIIYSKLPYKVVINEAIELAKRYGDDNSYFFVNGILANIVKELKLEDSAVH